MCGPQKSRLETVSFDHTLLPRQEPEQSQSSHDAADVTTRPTSHAQEWGYLSGRHARDQEGWEGRRAEAHKMETGLEDQLDQTFHYLERFLGVQSILSSIKLSHN